MVFSSTPASARATTVVRALLAAGAVIDRASVVCNFVTALRAALARRPDRDPVLARYARAVARLPIGA